MITNASWISSTVGMGENCPQFSKDITITRCVKSAELSITAIGVYEAYLNGKRVGDFILAPGCTVYRNRLQYQTYDVAQMLGQNNELKVLVGTGWHRGRISANSTDINSMPCALIAELQITYDDGSREYIFTDESWSVGQSEILFSDIYDGETYDASNVHANMQKAQVLSLPKDTLIPQQGEIVCEHEHIKPAAYFVTPKGEHVIDFGQNFTGYIQLAVKAKKGDRIVISHAEVLDSDGNFYTENYRDAKAKLTYICRDGSQSYKPHFTFFGFRYIRLDEYPLDIDLNSFTGIAVYSDIKRTGHIVCSNAKINQLFSNVVWSQKSNFLDIPTDCPQRNERMGWLGDAQVFAKTAGYNFNVKKFFEKWMQDVCAEQLENGAIPDTVPDFWKMKKSSTAWGDAITIIPWQMYLLYGDKKILENNFDAMQKWVDFISNDTKEAYLWTCTDNEKKLWGKHYGDWLAIDAPSGSYKGMTDEDFIASAFYSHSVYLLVKAGRVLGKDMTAYETLYKNIAAAFKKRFGVLKTQTEHVLALYFNLTDKKQETADKLVQMIKANGNKLQTGFVGTPYLLHVLSENGYDDVAYSLLFQEEYPSWLYEVNKGATTIWEHWDGIRADGTFWSSDMNSYNHYAYGSVMDWVYMVAGGIKTEEEQPGFERTVIAPAPGRQLQWLEVSLDTKHGTIISKWMYCETNIRYEITVPTPATVIIDEKAHAVEKGSYIFYGKIK